ncbi:hypothetical protein AMTR_s00101p00052410 [Amborella trichopoda]|uniref:TPX2 C-terminal domain-containing protein n=1 Tax=Amborella trichopoda TaxID=13333 RepID=W1NTY0_AMBTC|nr:hypothetical protein AMTR_s00101p00052410 [Amborella trichopoda]
MKANYSCKALGCVLVFLILHSLSSLTLCHARVMRENAKIMREKERIMREGVPVPKLAPLMREKSALEGLEKRKKMPIKQAEASFRNVPPSIPNPTQNK